MELISTKRYIDFKVYDVTKIKDKYGFRIKLIFDDNTEAVQQKSGYTSIRIAKAERDKTLGELYSRNYVVQEKVTVRDFFEYWLENEMKIKITYNSYASYKNIIHHHIIPNLGNITMTLLNKGQIQSFYENEAQKSHSSLRLSKAVLDSALKYALRKQIITSNPSIGIKLPKGIKKKEYRTLKINTQKTLNIDQLKLLIESAKGSSIYMQILFSGLMGLRESEVNGLKYSDIDFVNRKLKVQRQLGIVANSKKESYKTKTFSKQEIPLKTKSSYRELDIPDLVFEAILQEKVKYQENKRRRQNDKTNPFQDLGYICCSSYGRPRCRTYNFPHFKKLLKENELPDIRWHDLRATYATLLMKNDFNLKAISKKMGHAKQIITADVYGDKKEIIKDCIDNLEPFLMEVLPKEGVIKLNDLTLLSDTINNNMASLIEYTTEHCTDYKDLTESIDEVSIIDDYWTMITA